MTQLYQPKSSVPKAQTNNLFSGIWIRWRALTLGERFVCANIILIPIWWVAGVFFMYMPVILLGSVAVYECLQHGKIHLKRPSSLVVTFFVFGIYEVVRLFFFGTKVRGGLENVVLYTVCPACWLWYIQSKKIRIRIEAVAWACTVSVIQMFGFWLLLQFVLPTTIFPQPNLLALLTGSINPLSSLNPIGGGSHPFGFERVIMFFGYPEFLAIVAGFMGIVALDIKNRFWSWLLFLACVFLIFLSATRIVWLTFPIVVGLRYIFSNFGKPWVPPTFFALIAAVSFTTLSIPPATNLVLNQFRQSAQAVDNLRAGSTDARSDVYKQTWTDLQENPLWGYRSVGEPAGDRPPPGTHSVILGSLLYQKGLVGTVIFIFFWISLLFWFYKTRAERPLTCFCVWLLYTLVSPTLELVYVMPVSSLLILLCAAMRRPQLRSIKGY